MLGAAITVAYCSNLVSAVVLELRLARMIDVKEFHGRPFYVLSSLSLHDSLFERLSHSQAAALVAFRLVGAHAKPYFEVIPGSFDGFPWADLDLPNILVPFRVSVQWGIQEGPLAGAGVRTSCTCVFGFVLREESRSIWAS